MISDSIALILLNSNNVLWPDIFQMNIGFYLITPTRY